MRERFFFPTPQTMDEVQQQVDQCAGQSAAAAGVGLFCGVYAGAVAFFCLPTGSALPAAGIGATIGAATACASPSLGGYIQDLLGCGETEVENAAAPRT